MKSIKSIRGVFVMLLISGATSLMVTSCGSLSNMSYEDAYNVGYGAGTLLRYAIDN